MASQHDRMRGVHLPLVTPFLNGEVDFASLDRLVDRYLDSGVASFVLLGTTGESAVLDAKESVRVVERVAERSQRSLPLFLGVSGNDTRSVASTVKGYAALPVDGYLVTAPYYSRPSQAGLLAHFDAVVQETDRDVIVYNIPYRTGVNLSNAALFELLDRHHHVVAIKDSCGDVKQSMELLREGRDRLAILAGDDRMFFSTVALGGAGGILAASHVATERFVQLHGDLAAGDLAAARATWDDLSAWIPLLFTEPNPAPLKEWLAAQGLIDSPECRLPLAPVSDDLRQELTRSLPTHPLSEETS